MRNILFYLCYQTEWFCITPYTYNNKQITHHLTLIPLWLLFNSAFECIILNGHVDVSCCLATAAVSESNESTERREHMRTEE